MQERSRPASPISPTKAFFPVYLNPPSSPRASTPRILPTPIEIPPEDLEDLGLASCTKRAIAKEVLTLVSERNRAKREKKSRYQEEEQRAFIASLDSCRQAREDEGRNQRLASEEAWEDIDEARRYVERFLDDKWEAQRVNIQIDSEFNMDMVDLTAIGAMKRKEGVKACMKLLTAPVIHEKVSLSLWRMLVGRVSEREVAEDAEEEDEADDETTLNFLTSASSSKRSLGSSSTNLRFLTEKRRMTRFQGRDTAIAQKRIVGEDAGEAASIHTKKGFGRQPGSRPGFLVEVDAVLIRSTRDGGMCDNSTTEQTR
ncbi:hypothetical protein ACHAPW_007661 [Verticillium nonalfalfae]